MTMHRVYLSLGSNLGDRAGYLREAVARLGALPETQVTAQSRVIETPPWGVTDQPAFLNMAAALETALAPEALLAAVKAIETDLGRVRTEHWGPRTVDIDILIYEGETRDTPTLRLPHPYLTQRRFVLEPLAEIAPDLVVAGKTVREWLAALEE
ncbi:MAG: Bifunctional folate synthesis protein [bacterium ADurb.Bin429]|nr:MAG: Bifunctional folate synthesis protein [bacterium ADurb.Bin429]